MEEGGGIGPLGEMLFGGLPLLRGKECGACSYEKDERWMALRKLRGSFNLGDLGTGGRRLGWGQASKQAKLAPHLPPFWVSMHAPPRPPSPPKIVLLYCPAPQRFTPNREEENYSEFEGDGG